MAISPGIWAVIATVLLMRGLFAAFPAASTGRVDAGDILMMDRFLRWQAIHNRSYTSAGERLRRFQVYRDNVEYIDATNRRGDLTYELGENQFTDLTREEFLARYTFQNTGDRTDVGTSVITTTTGAGDDAGLRSSGGGGNNSSLEAPLPPSVDWRAKGAVTPVKNQGSTCGSCWAFVTVATIESLHWIKKGKLVSLSEQQLLDCDQYDNGCNPSLYNRAIDWVVQNGGLTTEADYPYKAVKGPCDRAKNARHVASITGQVFVPKGELALQQAVAGQPVAVNIEVGAGWEFYKSGVYSGPCGTNVGHAVTVVGYGTDPSTKVDYWIVKNSWGQTWGDNGYIRMKRGVGGPGLCGIALYGDYPTM